MMSSDAGLLQIDVQRLNEAVTVQQESFAAIQQESFGKVTFGLPLAPCHALLLGTIPASKEVVGYIILRFNSVSGCVEQLAVAQSSRRRGVGNQLLGSAMDFLLKRKKSSLSLHVNVENSNAISLYKKLGFQDVGVKEDFYALGEHASYMERELL